jgi:hypothetical protein
MFINFRYRKLIVFYQIREEVKIINIVTQCKIVKPRKFKKNYFKIPNISRDINWFTINKLPCILNFIKLNLLNQIIYTTGFSLRQHNLTLLKKI